MALALFIVAVTWKEPFPAIMMPRFTSQMDYNGIIRYTEPEVVIYYKDASITTTKHELLHLMHLPQRNKVMKRVFGLEKDVEVDQETKIWLYYRSQQIAQRSDIRKMEIRWYSFEYKLQSDKKPEKKDLIGQKEIRFEG